MAIRTEPRRKPQQARSRACVDALLTATAQILVEETYDRASTNKIARRAGVSIGSLYHYFPSKEALVAALIERRMEQQRVIILSTLATIRDAPFREATRTMIGAIAKLAKDDPALQRVINEQVPRVGKIEEALAVERRLARSILPVLQERRAELRRDDLELAAFVVVHLVSSTFFATSTGYPDKVTSGALEEELTDLVTRYLCVDEPSETGGVG